MESNKHNGKKSTEQLFHESFCYRWFRSFSDSDKNFETGFFARLLHVKRLQNGMRNFKNTFAAKCEESVFCTSLCRFYEHLVRCSLRSVGVLLLYFSVYAFAIGAVRTAVERDVTRYADNMFDATVVFAVALLLLFCRESLLGFAQKSRILSRVFDACLFTRGGVADDEPYRAPNGLLVVCGTLMGLATFFTSVRFVISVLFFAFLVISLFKVPENGMTAPILLCPFLPPNRLSLLLTSAFVAYLFKTFRGKRNFRFGSFDCMVLLFTAVLLCGAFTSSQQGSDAWMKVSAVLMYFLFRNCIRNELMLRKCATAVMLAGAEAGIWHLLSRLTEYERLVAIRCSVPLNLSFSIPKMFESHISFGEFLLLAVPFCVMLFSVAKNKNQSFFALICLVFCVAPLLLLRSKGLLLALMVGVLLYIVAAFHNPIASLVTLLTVCLAFSLFITNSAFLGNDRFFNVNDYKESILTVMTEIVAFTLPAGIGLGKENFAAVFRVFSGFGEGYVTECYNVYMQMTAQLGVFGVLFFVVMTLYLFRMLFSALSLSRGKNTLFEVTAVTSLGAVSSMLIRGLTSDIFADLRVLLLLTAVIGCAAADFYMSRDLVLRAKGEDEYANANET